MPCTTTSPRSGASSPAISRSVVLLPVPDPPSCTGRHTQMSPVMSEARGEQCLVPKSKGNQAAQCLVNAQEDGTIS